MVKKKMGKIERAYNLREQGKSFEQIAKKLNISKRLAYSYWWRKANPEKFKELLKRYYDKKKAKSQKKQKKEKEQ